MATLYTEDQLKNLILWCKDENTNYPKPDNMIDDKGNKLYAYVTLITLGDRYIPGDIVLAHSIRRLESEADLVVLVTPDVSEDGKRLLATFYDKIVLVDPIIVPNWRVKKQPYRLYLNYVFTKFHLFNLEYKKVLMIDADALIIKHPDHLFTLEAPAGSLIEYKEEFITYDKNGNYILQPNNKIKWYDTYCKCCAHGKKIPKQYTDNVAKDIRNSGIGASIVLLSPKKGELDAIIKDVTTDGSKMKYLVQNKFAWPEQQYLTLRYSGNWTSVNPRFYGLQGYPHWSVLFSVQYAGDKPWFLDSKTDINIRTQYPDFIVWHKFYSEILDKFPHFKTNKVLDETNQMHQFFIVKIHQQKRLLSKYTGNKTIDEIKYMIKKYLDIKQVNDEQIDMYFLNSRLSYHPYELKPMFQNILEYEYLKPYELLSKNFPETNYFHNILKNNIFGNERLDKIIDKQNLKIDIFDLDNIILQYIKCRPQSFVITIWPIASHLTENIINELAINGNIYYVKRIQLSYNGLRNLMFWMYDEFTFTERNTFITKKLDYVAAKKFDNQISIIIFDNVKNLNISGQASEFKKYIRNFALNLINSDSELRGNDIMHINDHFYQTISYAELLLNNNSIYLLNNQTINLHNMTYLDRIAHYKFQTFKKFLYSNLSLLEIYKIIVMGGSILYSYGIRPMMDIDVIMTNPHNQELEQLMYDNFINNQTKFLFSDMGIEGKYWRDTWTTRNNMILNYFNINSIYELNCNPKYHMYFQGVKLYLLDHEIIRKLYRFKSQDFADFIIMVLHFRNLINKYITIDDNTHKLIIRDNKLIINKYDKRFITYVYHSIKKKYPKYNIPIKIITELISPTDKLLK